MKPGYRTTEFIVLAIVGGLLGIGVALQLPAITATVITTYLGSMATYFAGRSYVKGKNNG